MPLWVYMVCVLLACAVALLWHLERRERSKFRGLPSYPLLPFIGNIHQLFGDGRHLFRHFDRIAEICENSILPFVVWLGPCSILVTQDPDDVKTITNAFIEKPYYYGFGRIWLGDGLVTAPGYIWKHNIKTLAGTFTSSVVDGYYGVFNAQAHKLVENVKTEVGRGHFDIIHKYLALTTLETICQTALGVSKISESIVTTEYYEAFNRCLELIISRALNVLIHPDTIYRLTPAHREMTKCVAILHHVSDTVMKKRKLERKNTKKSIIGEKDCDAKDGPKFKAFLDILMELSETDATLTEQQIKSEVDTIIVGGQETVASTLFYALLMIGCKPRIQEKLHAEFKSIFGDSKRPVCKDDLARMEYCEAIINETLRMYPPVPGILRYADKDLPLKSFTIPKGTACGINIWGAGRSVRVWGADAKVYRPERWLEDQPPGTPAAFLAFSYGRRACIGIPIFFYVLALSVCLCYFYVYVVSMIWFVCIRCPATGDLLAAIVVFSLGVASEIGTVKLIYMFLHMSDSECDQRSNSTDVERSSAEFLGKRSTPASKRKSTSVKKSPASISDKVREIVSECLACNSSVVAGSRFSNNLLSTLRQVKKRAMVFWVVIIGNGVVYVIKPIIMPGRHFTEDMFILLGLEPMHENPNYPIATMLFAAGVVFTCYVPANITAFLIVITGYIEAQMLSLTDELLHLWEDAEEHFYKTRQAVSILNNNNTEFDLKNKAMNDYVEKHLKEIIRAHGRNINLLHQVEKVFSGAIAIEFLLLVIGLIAELLGGLENTYLEIPFALMQVGMDCLTGQRVMDANVKFERAVYDSKWENYNISNMKIILMMLQSSQKTMKLSAGGLIMLSSSCFMLVIRSIYSAYTTLRSTIK